MYTARHMMEISVSLEARAGSMRIIEPGALFNRTIGSVQHISVERADKLQSLVAFKMLVEPRKCFQTESIFWFDRT